MSERKPRRRPSVFKLTLLGIGAALLVLLGAVGLRLAVPPAPYPIPADLALDWSQERFDSPDNAWHLYQQATRLSQAVQHPWDPNRPTDEQIAWQQKDPREWTNAEAVAAGAWVDAYAEALEVFERAAAQPYFLEQQMSPDVLLPHLGQTLALARALIFRAGLAERAGDEAAAVRDLLVSLRGSVLVDHGGPQISRLTAIAGEAQVSAALWRGVGVGQYRRAATYRTVIEGLQRLEAERAPLSEFIRAEYAAFNGNLNRLARGNLTDTTRVLGNGEESQTQWDSQTLAIFAAARLQFRGGHREAAAFYRALIRDADADPATLARGTNPDTRREAQHLLVQLFMPVIARPVERDLTVRASTRALLLAAALQAYRLERGRFPGRVEDLLPDYLDALPLDPFTGHPFTARRTADGYEISGTGRAPWPVRAEQ